MSKDFLLNTEDIDPDLNYYNNIAFVDAIYRLPSEIDAVLKENTNTKFSLMHANCRGFQYNFDKLLSSVTNITNDLSVIAVSETWTNCSNENDYQLPHYNLGINSRVNKSCGGVGLFVHDSLHYKLRKDLCNIVPDVFECIFIELDVNKVIVGCLYRPPCGNLSTFIAHFDTLLSKLNNEKKNLLYCR